MSRFSFLIFSLISTIANPVFAEKTVDNFRCRDSRIETRNAPDGYFKVYDAATSKTLVYIGSNENRQYSGIGASTRSNNDSLVFDLAEPMDYRLDSRLDPRLNTRRHLDPHLTWQIRLSKSADSAGVFKGTMESGTSDEGVQWTHNVVCCEMAYPVIVESRDQHFTCVDAARAHTLMIQNATFGPIFKTGTDDAKLDLIKRILSF